jgi:hypothetical protein
MDHDDSCRTPAVNVEGAGHSHDLSQWMMEYLLEDKTVRQSGGIGHTKVGNARRYR